MSAKRDKLLRLSTLSDKDLKQVYFVRLWVASQQKPRSKAHAKWLRAATKAGDELVVRGHSRTDAFMSTLFHHD